MPPEGSQAASETPPGSELSTRQAGGLAALDHRLISMTPPGSTGSSMNPSDETRDEEQIASLLKTIDTDAATVDRDALARLLGKSTEAFRPAATKRQKLLRIARWVGAAAAAILLSLGLY